MIAKCSFKYSWLSQIWNNFLNWGLLLKILIIGDMIKGTFKSTFEEILFKLKKGSEREEQWKIIKEQELLNLNLYKHIH